MSNLGKEHWIVVKRIFRYLCGTSDYAICYQGRLGPNKVVNVQGFVDVDWVEILIAKDLQVVMCLTCLVE
jgi:hypothetical protein